MQSCLSLIHICSFNANKNSSSSFSGEVTAKENERLFLSLPYENGWNVYVDGEKVETEKVFEDVYKRQLKYMK